MRSSANALPRLSYASPSREQQSPGDATAARRGTDSHGCVVYVSNHVGFSET